MKSTKKLKKMLESKPKKVLTSKDFLSTGSTLLNLACSNKPYCGFAKGKYYFIVGDSASGKTFLSLTCLAEASVNDNFKDYRFIYDNSEDGALMDIKKYFGKKVYERMEPPAKALIFDSEQSIFSSTIEEFYYNLDDAIKRDVPFIYILDSMDSLSSDSEADKFEEKKEAHTKGKKTAGSYGDGKAKMNSTNLRRMIARMRKTGSILIVLSQTRDNMGFGFETKTRAGGHALRFYACIELWSSVKEKIRKNINGKPHQIGITCLIKIKKNRITGAEHTLTFPIYYSFGIDDIGGCVNYLIDEGHWKCNAGIVKAKEMSFEGKIEKLVKHIEENNMEKDLRDLVGDVWNEIQEACQVKRKQRYE